MKKKIILISMFFSLVILATIGTKIANSNKMSAAGMIFSNMEALASDIEDGVQGHPCTFSREYTGLEYNKAYECINRGSTICIIWEKCKQTGTKAGNCTNAK